MFSFWIVFIDFGIISHKSKSFNIFCCNYRDKRMKKHFSAMNRPEYGEIAMGGVCTSADVWISEGKRHPEKIRVPRWVYFR